MSLQAPIIYCLPEETARVAHAAFPNGTPDLRMRDVLGPIYLNPDFAARFPATGHPAYAPAQLARVTIMQFAEGLSDAQAADAVRSRIDWKYVLALDLTDSGFHASVLAEFRTRLVAGHAEHLLFETMLTLFHDHGLLKARGRQRTDSTHVLAAIQVLNRLECIGETLRHALNTVATVAPAWLRAWVPAAWFDRYGRRFEEYRLPPGNAERYALAAQSGADGQVLLQTLYAPTAPAWVRGIPAVQVLRRVWIPQVYAVADDQPMRWRIAGDLPSAPLLMSSPYDPEARDTKRRDTEWTGYKVHLTETCEDDLPNLITDVTTTTAPILDSAMLPTIQAQLAARKLTPQEHLVDSGYRTADHFRNSGQDYARDFVGPASTNRSWQAQGEGDVAATQFVIDWEARHATCRVPVG